LAVEEVLAVGCRRGTTYVHDVVLTVTSRVVIYVGTSHLLASIRFGHTDVAILA
jgi:hypothetical protein